MALNVDGRASALFISYDNSCEIITFSDIISHSMTHFGSKSLKHEWKTFGKWRILCGFWRLLDKNPFRASSPTRILIYLPQDHI